MPEKMFLSWSPEKVVERDPEMGLAPDHVFIDVHLEYRPVFTKESNTNMINTPKNMYRMTSSVTWPVFWLLPSSSK